MATTSHGVLDHLRSFLSRGRGAAEDDGQLLRQFVCTRDGDAFAALLHRHGPMVLGLARRVAEDWQTAEDVFQATFLMLARRAQAIRRPESLSCWLHGVAFRLALRARHSRRRRTERETHGRHTSPPTPLDELSARELLVVLDEELQDLSENYRAAVILCCLEGLSQEEAAKRLRCSPGAVKGRLERGRNQLRRRLERRGLMMPAVLGGTLLLTDSAHALPSSLLHLTLNAVRTSAATTPAAAALVREAMRSAMVNRMKAIGAALVLLAVSGGGLAMLESNKPAAREEPTSEAAVKRMKVLGLRAEPALRAALKAKPSLEQKRRIETILATLTEAPPSAEELRQLRALIVLERIGTPEARRIVAKGPETARLTRQALAVLACMR